MINRLDGGPRLTFGGDRRAGVGIRVKPRKVAAGDFDAQTMSSRKHDTRVGQKWNVRFVLGPSLVIRFRADQQSVASKCHRKYCTPRLPDGHRPASL